MKVKAASLVSGALRILLVVLTVVFASTFLTHVLPGRVIPDLGEASTGTAFPSEPWTDAQTVKPADLVKEIADAKNRNRPVIVCTGYQVLYESGHIPGAVFHGSASKPEGLDDLKKWAEGIPRSSNIVVYCGCCRSNIVPIFVQDSKRCSPWVFNTCEFSCFPAVSRKTGSNRATLMKKASEGGRENG